MSRLDRMIWMLAIGLMFVWGSSVARLDDDFISWATLGSLAFYTAGYFLIQLFVERNIKEYLKDLTRKV